MASFNKVILIGNMTQDPELKQTAGGISVCSFSIAINRRFAKEGEQKCDFITVVAWRQSAEFVSRYFRKGNPILVCGQLQTRNWTDNQGQKRYVTEVVAEEINFVESRGDGENAKPTETVPPNPANLGGKSYTPSAYSDNTYTQFEEIAGASELPLPF